MQKENLLVSRSFDIEKAKKQADLNDLLNKRPNPKWVKQDHPYAKQLKYLPINRIETLLRQVFGNFEVTVISYSLIANSVSVHVRLKVVHPFTGEEIYQDGLGAVALQTDSGAGATDFNKIKSNAVMLALPAAKSFAVKDAAELLGDLFGASLNRKDDIAFSSAIPTMSEDIFEKITACKTKVSLQKIIDENAHLHSLPDFKNLINVKMMSL